MDCHHFNAGRCRSCSWLERDYDDQLHAKQAQLAELLAPWPDIEWLAPAVSAEAGFRNKAKMVVAGSVEAPVLGLVDRAGVPVDLSDCALYAPELTACFPALAAFVSRAGLTPYDVAARRGELKFILVTLSASGALMVRFVLRSTEAELRIRKHLSWLLAELPNVRVVSINLQPEHKAVLEGEREIVLTDADTLTMPINGIDLHLRAQSFFQTNTAIASELYSTATEWVREVAPTSLWDLYCGVGGFALHAARAAVPQVHGVEISAEAVASAQSSAAELGLTEASFEAADATAWALAQADVADLVVVNPPRRGIGAELAGWLEGSGVSHVVYSSCNAVTLAKDLAVMGSLKPVRARLLDMFPHTAHYEVAVLLTRS